ncbi:hypothetical protein ONZ45_g6764 [Pleurotus djamor]|nr:hypothetical protein ONZ45_g6764 [Pleurotus djamor]
MDLPGSSVYSISRSSPNPLESSVVYKPAPYTPQWSLATLRETHDIRYIRIYWIDFTNVMRYRILPVAFFAKLVETTSRPGINIFKGAFGTVYSQLADGFGPAGEYLYVVDLTTLRSCAYAPGHASLLGWFQEKDPRPDVDKPLAFGINLCPRAILNRVIQDAESTLDLSFLLGFETEFTLLSSTSPIQVPNDSRWCTSASLHTGTPEAKVITDIIDALVVSGVEVQVVHSECGPSQYEVVTAPMGPLEAVDTLIHTRETIYNIARKHGLWATLAPRIFPDCTGSGAHAHISLHPRPMKSNLNLNARSSVSPNLTNLESSFLASLLASLPSVIALLLPIPASFKRMVDGAWAGGTYVCWGSENREVPVRLCNPSSQSSKNFEVKLLDGTANPYLAVAAILGVGLEGIRNAMELKIKDWDGDEMISEMDEKRRQELGVRDRLPLCWEDARRTFGECAAMRKLFGDDFVDKYLSVNKTLAECLEVGSEEERLTRLVSLY